MNTKYESIKQSVFSKAPLDEFRKQEQQKSELKLQGGHDEPENTIKTSGMATNQSLLQGEDRQLQQQLIKNQLADFINHIDKTTLEKCDSLTFIPNFDAIEVNRSIKPAARKRSNKQGVNVNNIFISQNTSKSVIESSSSSSTMATKTQNESSLLSNSRRSLLDSFVVLSDDEQNFEETFDFNNIPKEFKGDYLKSKLFKKKTFFFCFK